MKKVFVALFVLSFFVNFYAQSVHRYFWEAARKQVKKRSTENVPEEKFSAFGTHDLSHAVFGFLPDWEYVSDSKNYLRLDLLTHVAVFGFTADENGNLQTPLAWPWSDFIDAAHASNTKVIMTVISFDNATTHSLLSDSTARNNLFANISEVISQNNLDGVNLDFEGLYENDRGTLLNSFVSLLKDYLGETLEVSFDAPAWNWGGWDFAGLSAACDYLFVMEYDYFGAWSEQSGPTAPLTGNGVSVTRSIDEQFADVAPQKIILGVPYYGIHWTTEDDNENSDVKNFLDYLTYRNIKSGYEWNDTRWSENYSTPWFAWREDSTHQLWFDDINSLAAKYDFAVSRNLKGVGIWALGFDGRRTELWDLINEKFGDGVTPRPEPPVGFEINFKEINGESFDEIKFHSSPRAENYVVYESDDGINFSDSIITADTIVLVPRNEAESFRTRFYKAAAKNQSGVSLSTTTLAVNFSSETASNEKAFLIVDGFDRYYGNGNKFDYVTKVAPLFDSLGIPFVSADNEAIIKRGNNMRNIFWILGNESRTTETLNFFEQKFLREIDENASSDAPFRLFISGSEIGYDLADVDFSAWFDEEFYADILHAEYISDAPRSRPGVYYTAENINGSAINYDGLFRFDDGAHGTFNVGYPDAVLSNAADSLNDLAYAGVTLEDGAAGISYRDEKMRAVYFGFPLETVFNFDERYELFEKAMNFLFANVSAVPETNYSPDKIELMQNYPNPFNPVTTIKYSIPKNGGVETHGRTSLRIYKVLGEEIATLVNEKQTPGNYSVKFDALNLPSGVYFSIFRVGKIEIAKKMLLLK